MTIYFNCILKLRADSSAGRAIARHAIGRRFDPCSAHHFCYEKKKSFLKKTLATGLAAGAVSSSLFFPNIVSSKKKHTWVAVSAFDKAGILGRAFTNICDEITRISDGALNIRLFHANELVSAFESFDVVQSGTCQLGFGSPYYWAGKSSSISLLSGIPLV